MDKRFTWIVRFDVAPEWVADGFTMSDDTALEILSDKLSFADMDTELAARVIAAPSSLTIAQEQGYTQDRPARTELIEQMWKAAPLAYENGNRDRAALTGALADAIRLLDSVAFVSHENDATGAVLSKLRDALALVRGDDALPGESVVGDESHHSHINGGDL